MSTAARVPETVLMPGEKLSAESALLTLWHVGPYALARDAFVRFRYGDGFSHARALALQFCLSFIPLAIALIGLAAVLGQHTVGTVVSQIVLRLTPGQQDVVDDVVRQSLTRSDDSGEIALWLGLAAALVAMTTAMAQVERGANRIYGIQRDRPTARKYAHAVFLTFAAGLPAMLGFLTLVAGAAVGDALAIAYHWGLHAPPWWHILRWPLGLALTWASYTVLLARAPHRRQPTFSWLAVGGGVAIVLWLLVTVLLALYVGKSAAFRSTYGPVTSVFALMLWANLTSVALLFGTAVCAQLEAARAGAPAPTTGDEPAPSATQPAEARVVHPAPG